MATIGIIPCVARPAAIVTACCSAIPTSKNLLGNKCLNSKRPVPDAIAAVIATIFSHLFAKLIKLEEKLCVNVISLFFSITPSSKLKGGVP